MCVSAWAKGLIRYFGVFHDQPPCSNLRFRNPEKISERDDLRVWPTRVSGFSHYLIMVNSQGVMSMKN